VIEQIKSKLFLSRVKLHYFLKIQIKSLLQMTILIDESLEIM